MSLSEYDRRQLGHLRTALVAYEKGLRTLAHLIDELSVLLEVLEEVPAQWKDEFRSEWWTLEQIHAVALDRGEATLSEDDKDAIKVALNAMQRLICEQLGPEVYSDEA